jgi:deoxyribonuclease-4
VSVTPRRATEIGANAFALFTKNQRRWQAPPIAEEEAAAFRAELETSGISVDHVIIHDSYLINPGNPDPEKRRRSIDALLDEAKRAEQLGLRLLNFHPGSGLGTISAEETVTLVAEAVAEVLSATSDLVLVVENTAGGGGHVGRSFEELSQIIRLAAAAGAGRSNDLRSRLGVCLDTCHLFAAGYDLRTRRTYEATMAEFDRIVGLDRLRGIHVNDAAGELGGRRDRHASIGEGALGESAFRLLMTDERLRHVPMVLETPNMDLWPREIDLLRRFAAGERTRSNG